MSSVPSHPPRPGLLPSTACRVRSVSKAFDQALTGLFQSLSETVWARVNTFGHSGKQLCQARRTRTSWCQQSSSARQTSMPSRRTLLSWLANQCHALSSWRSLRATWLRMGSSQNKLRWQNKTACDDSCRQLQTSLSYQMQTPMPLATGQRYRKANSRRRRTEDAPKS
jgi:hypothetical protein